MAELRRAKHAVMEQEELGQMSEDDVITRITRRELELHCRRRTRGTDATTRLMQTLIDTMDSDMGRDTLGVPLLDHEKIQQEWSIQKQHVGCIQDPEGVQLYTQTGTSKKGGVELKIFRCARGSTSLESFHVHLKNFIPGTTASDQNFQAFLREGIVRWNDDRAAAALQQRASSLRSYSNTLRFAVNELYEKVLGTQKEDNERLGAYTGDILGVEYLYDQTGESLAFEELDCETPDVDDEDEEDLLPCDEGFVEADNITVGGAGESLSSRVSAPTSPSPSRRQPSSPAKQSSACTFGTHSLLRKRSHRSPSPQSDVSDVLDVEDVPDVPTLDVSDVTDVPAPVPSGRPTASE